MATSKKNTYCLDNNHQSKKQNYNKEKFIEVYDKNNVNIGIIEEEEYINILCNPDYSKWLLQNPQWCDNIQEKLAKQRLGL